MWFHFSKLSKEVAKDAFRINKVPGKSGAMQRTCSKEQPLPTYLKQMLVEHLRSPGSFMFMSSAWQSRHNLPRPRRPVTTQSTANIWRRKQWSLRNHSLGGHQLTISGKEKWRPIAKLFIRHNEKYQGLWKRGEKLSSIIDLQVRVVNQRLPRQWRCSHCPEF